MCGHYGPVSNKLNIYFMHMALILGRVSICSSLHYTESNVCYPYRFLSILRLIILLWIRSVHVRMGYSNLDIVCRYRFLDRDQYNRGIQL